MALIALGSNETMLETGPEATISSAIDEIGRKLGKIDATSWLYRTPCFPAGSGPDFVNAAVAVTTEMSARQVLTLLHQIEADFGRVRRKRWGQRVLDLDLLALGDQVLPDHAKYQQWRDLDLATQMEQAPDELILPHPRIQDRSFVLRPLADVAPEWRHPVLGQSVVQMLAARPAEEQDEIVQIG
ncbi:2-amino-4-hydroxy-6-hydroxymethyldihydropteridine diphosphokinase [Aestuariibius sp. HNIBRBA575]|uniref:2-amino-4-hydroxy-6- hydroxymethyldihydropteridine diphosphokinase n=1 Tax=Aestuariibius sp. HNIBRBA575 TaxID=3233343 RepID=UPI0034A143BA